MPASRIELAGIVGKTTILWIGASKIFPQSFFSDLILEVFNIKSPYIMNNSWKFIGGGGAALAALLQLYTVSEVLNWGSSFQIAASVLQVFCFAAIAAGFFMAQGAASVVSAPSESVAPNPVEPDVPSVGQWLGWMLLLSIPLVNLVLMVMWAIDRGNQIRRNWILATLVITGIVTVLYAILMATMLSSMY